MADIKITDAEFAALYGLPVLAQLLYFYLRRRMDFSTGMVGVVTGVSWWALREDLHVEHAQGRSRLDSGTPTEKVVRHAAAVLEEAGLVINKSQPRQLFFHLPLAGVSARPKEVGQTCGTLSGQVLSTEVGQTKNGEVWQTEKQAAQGESGEVGQVLSTEVGQTKTGEVGQTKTGEVGHTSGFRGVLSNLSGKSSSVGLRELGSGAVAPDISDLPNPPTQPGHWLTWFNRVHGTEYSPTNVRDRKSIWPVLQGWLKAGVRFEQMDKAVEHAYATASEPIGNLVLYCDKVLTSMQSGGAGRSSQRRQTCQALTGGTKGWVIDVTANRVD